MMSDSVAALWLVGANEGAQIEPHLSPSVSQAEYSESVKIELQSNLVIGWGAFSDRLDQTSRVLDRQSC